jgi:hypothetical protein
MNIELYIIKVLLKKHFYNKYYKYIDRSKHSVYEHINKAHEMSQNDISVEELMLLSPDNITVLNEVKQLPDVSEEIMQNVVEQFLQRQWAHDVALAAINISEGKGNIEELEDVYNRKVIDVSVDNSLVTDDFELLEKEVDRNGGLQWRLSWLNRVLGGLHKGDFGFVFARTNTGKSTFIASEVSFMLSQAKPTLFCFNEEAAARMKWRIFQAYFGATDERLKENRQKCADIFLSETNLKFHDMPMMHKRDIEGYCELYTPQLIVIDNIDKIYGFKGDREDLRLGKIYTWAREIAKTYAPVIAVCQAGSTAENKKWLQHTDIASAHTAKSSEADFILGIGYTNDIGMEDVRFIRTVKNKFRPGEHRTECLIDALHARFKEI